MLGEVSIPDAPAAGPLMEAAPRKVASRQPAPAPEESKPAKLGGLVLTRHLGESIMIGEDVEVQVVGLKSGTVRLKVVAPRTIPVHRREVFDTIRSEIGLAVPPPVAQRPAMRSVKPAGGLVLARCARESIMIGEDVEIGVVEVRPSTVKLRISAPKSVAVHRREIFESLRDDLA